MVVDPRRTRTAEEAVEHHFIRPGTDALLLAAMACTIVEEELEDVGALAEHLNGLDEVRALVREFTPESVADACGIEAERDPADGARAGGSRARARSTGGSAPARRSSARTRAGWWTC